MNKRKELNEQRNDLVDQAEAVLAKAKTETRELTEEELATLNDIKAKVDRIDQTIQMSDAFAHLGEEEEANNTEEEEKPMNENEKRALEQKQEEADVRGFAKYIRGYALQTRDDPADPEPTTLNKGDNGAVIPVTIVRRILKRVYEMSPILEKAEKYTMKGAVDLPFYDTTDDTITVAYHDEFTSLSSRVGKLNKIRLTGFLAGALALVSVSLINNSDVDVVNFVVEEMASAIKRWLEGEAVKGTSQKIDGLSTLTNLVTAASTTKVTMDELIDTQELVADDFQDAAIWIMNKKTRTAIRKLKNDIGEYLLQRDPTAPWGYVLLGKPVYTTDSLQEMAAGRKVIYYGDFSGLVLKVAEDANVQVLRERYADQHAVGVVGWIEADVKVRNAQKLSGLKMAAS